MKITEAGINKISFGARDIIAAGVLDGSISLVDSVRVFDN
jgi:hypothetical protein